VDAEELLRSDESFVADTSAWWRAKLPDELGPLLGQAVLDDRFWITPIVRGCVTPNSASPCRGT
jgi:hypothetical protein